MFCSHLLDARRPQKPHAPALPICTCLVIVALVPTRFVTVNVTGMVDIACAPVFAHVSRRAMRRLFASLTSRYDHAYVVIGTVESDGDASTTQSTAADGPVIEHTSGLTVKS